MDDGQKKDSESKNDVNKKVDTVFKALIIGMAAVFLLVNPGFARFIPSELVLMLISGITLILCINVVIFCFVKPKAWLYRSIAALVSLLVGYTYFRFCISGLYYISDLRGVLPDFLFDMLGESPELPWLDIMEGVYLGYSALVFGTALLVQFIYKRVKRKMADTSQL